MPKFRVEFNKKDRFGIDGTQNLKSKSGGIYFKSKEVAQQRVDENNDWMKRNHTYDIHGIKQYSILPV